MKLRRPGAVYLIMAGYFLVNLLVGFAIPVPWNSTRPASLFRQWFAQGYDDQPPFYNWVQYAVGAASAIRSSRFPPSRTSCCFPPTRSTA